jgi:hypothetical protein
MEFLASPALLVVLYAETDIDGWRVFAAEYNAMPTYPACYNEACRGRHALCSPSKVTLGCINCLLDNKFCSMINNWFLLCIQRRLRWSVYHSQNFLREYNFRKSGLYQRMENNPYLTSSREVISRRLTYHLSRYHITY